MTEQFSADVEAVEPDMPVAFVFKSKSYTGQKTQTVDSLEMQDAGWQQKYDFELDARRNSFGTSAPPAKNDEIKIAAVSYRVEKVTASQDGVMLTLHMVERA